jgi:phosphohistidine phosphatase
VRVILLRHGIAVDRDDPRCPPDPERPLTREGVDRTRDAVAGLRAIGVRPAAVLASPYLRAMQTAEIASHGLGAPDPEPCPSLLPGAPAEAMGALLGGRSDEEILCAGHEPHLSLLLAYLVWGASGGGEFAGFKKAGAACVETLQPGTSAGELLWVLPPRILRKLGEGS